MKFILASKSPRRRDILKKGNFIFEVVPSKFDESKISKRLNPQEYCMQLARSKAKDILGKYDNYTIIGADTIVVIDNLILNKPKNISEAKNMLKLLSDREHQVITGVSLQNRTLNIDYTFFDISKVTFYKLSNFEINKYILDCSPLDKAGSYGIQDGSCLFVKEIKGSYDNIVGFPISKFYQVLKKIVK